MTIVYRCIAMAFQMFILGACLLGSQGYTMIEMTCYGLNIFESIFPHKNIGIFSLLKKWELF